MVPTGARDQSDQEVNRMRQSYAKIIPVDETVAPLSSEERDAARRRYATLDAIVLAAQSGDAEAVKALAQTL